MQPAALKNRNRLHISPQPTAPPGDIDYLVDALALHDSLAPVLGPILSDARITKVMHGCANDISWLQQVGCYAVNVFDTEKAAQVRGLPRFVVGWLLGRAVVVACIG